MLARDDYEALMAIALDWRETDSSVEFPVLVEVVDRLEAR